MKAFLIGLLAWSASAWLATINTLPYLAPAITLLGWCGAVVTVGSIIVGWNAWADRHFEEDNRRKNFPKRKVDVEVPA